jgi:hypothetical protein
VAFDADVWVVAGTAAPVIALAAVVLGAQTTATMVESEYWRDYLKDLLRYSNEIDPGPGLWARAVWRVRLVFKRSRDYTGTAGWAWDWAGRLNSANLLLQSIVLFLSLLSLAWHRALLWPWSVAVVEVAGIWLLVLAGWFNMTARMAVIFDQQVDPRRRSGMVRTNGTRRPRRPTSTIARSSGARRRTRSRRAGR